MKITQALLGEHGAIYPLFDLIDKTTASAGLAEIKARASSLESALDSHAAIEDELLRPAIQAYLPAPPAAPDGAAPPTDHEIIQVDSHKCRRRCVLR